MDIIGGVTSPKTAVSQPIRVADFVGATQSSPAVSVVTSKFASSALSRPAAASKGGVAVASGKKVAMIVEIVVILLLAGLSVFLYTQNASLSAKIANLTVSTGGAPAPASDLQGQLQTLTASQATLQGQVNDLTAVNNDLKAQLSFFAAPSGTPAVAASGTVAGMLAVSGVAKPTYSVRTQYDAVVFVKNSGDAKVAAALKPLVGSSVTLTGSYVPGSDTFTVVSVNGNPVNPPAVVATTTASTTAATSATTSNASTTMMSTTTITTVKTVTTSSTTVTTSTTP
jgi:cell division protein FtsL